jgi:hypothetical protein
MKKIFTAILLVTWMCQGAEAQRWGTEVGMDYVYTSPLGSMQHNIKQGNGVVVDFGMVTPSRRFTLGIEVQYTQYGHDESTQEYQFDDGSTANMDIIVNNSFLNFMAYGRYYVMTEGKFLPYLTAKGGYAHYSTDLNIYDPNEWDHCAPVESEILQKDGTLIGSLGAGFRLDMASVFRKSEPGKFYLDFHSSVTQGGTVKYMNSDAPDHHPANHDATDAVSAQFVNTQTQVYHSHHVGTLYTSPVQLLDFRLGAVFRFAR